MNTRLKTVILAVVVFLYWMGLYLYVPTLPTYVEGKTANLAVVGIVLSMYGLWQAIIRLPIGIAADWAGRRKPFILFGLLLVGLGAWLLGTAQGVNGLTVGRTITGLAAGTWVPLVVLFSSFFPPEEAVRASAILNFVAFGGRMLATGLTGTLNQAGGYSLAFYLATGVAAAAILVMLTIPEKRRKVQRPSTGDIAQLITRQDVLLPSLASTVSHYAIFATTFGFLPILAKQSGCYGCHPERVRHHEYRLGIGQQPIGDRLRRPHWQPPAGLSEFSFPGGWNSSPGHCAVTAGDFRRSDSWALDSG